MSTKKYRPYFSLSELHLLLDACATQAGKSPAHASMHSYLYKYIRDIDDGLRKENHITKPTILQSLELDEGESTVNNTNPYTKTPEQCYAEYVLRGSTYIGLSPARIATIQQYRYENDLFSPEEEAEYENSILKR